jgi:hypothetical protein
MKAIGASLLAVLVLALSGTMDKQDDKALLSDYCNQVKSDAWPNYKNLNLEETCK